MLRTSAVFIPRMLATVVRGRKITETMAKVRDAAS
jgi:hypothetical protein